VLGNFKGCFAIVICASQERRRYRSRQLNLEFAKKRITLVSGVSPLHINITPFRRLEDIIARWCGCCEFARKVRYDIEFYAGMQVVAEA